MVEVSSHSPSTSASIPPTMAKSHVKKKTRRKILKDLRSKRNNLWDNALGPSTRKASQKSVCNFTEFSKSVDIDMTGEEAIEL